jgi:hypothetical protein
MSQRSVAAIWLLGTDVFEPITQVITQAKCCAARGICGIEALLCIFPSTHYLWTLRRDLIERKGGMEWPNGICSIVGRMALEL